jgi:hypothetical protein
LGETSKLEESSVDVLARVTHAGVLMKTGLELGMEETVGTLSLSLSQYVVNQALMSKTSMWGGKWRLMRLEMNTGAKIQERKKAVYHTLVEALPEILTRKLMTSYVKIHMLVQLLHLHLLSMGGHMLKDLTVGEIEAQVILTEPKILRAPLRHLPASCLSLTAKNTVTKWMAAPLSPSRTPKNMARYLATESQIST